MTIEVKLQLPNAVCPMKITEFGMVTEVKLWQPEKALCMMEITELEKVTCVRFRQL